MSGIGSRLAELRGERRLSSREFAQAVAAVGYKITNVTVLDYEKARAKAPGEYLAVVCEAFDVNPAWLLLGHGPMRQSSRESSERAFEAIVDIVRREGRGELE